MAYIRCPGCFINDSARIEQFCKACDNTGYILSLTENDSKPAKKKVNIVAPSPVKSRSASSSTSSSTRVASPDSKLGSPAGTPRKPCKICFGVGLIAKKGDIENLEYCPACLGKDPFKLGLEDLTISKTPRHTDSASRSALAGAPPPPPPAPSPGAPKAVIPSQHLTPPLGIYAARTMPTPGMLGLPSVDRTLLEWPAAPSWTQCSRCHGARYIAVKGQIDIYGPCAKCYGDGSLSNQIAVPIRAIAAGSNASNRQRLEFRAGMASRECHKCKGAGVMYLRAGGWLARSGLDVRRTCGSCGGTGTV